MSIVARCPECRSDNLKPESDPPKDNTMVLCQDCGKQIGAYKQVMDALAKEGDRLFGNAVKRTVGKWGK